MPTPYDLNLKCLNLSCKSHGKPHPNCKCYGFSDGGQVGNFCSNNRAHNSDCEYFLSGGIVGQEVPSDDLPQKSSEQYGKEVPTEDIPNNKIPSVGQEVPSDDLPNDMMNAPLSREEQLSKVESERLNFTKGLEPLKAAARGFVQGLAGDLEKATEIKSGISTPEDIQKNENEFPGPHLVGKIAGTAAGWEISQAATGSKILSNIIMSYAPSIEDNISKALLDQPGGDFKTVVASSIIDGTYDLFANTITAGLFSKAESSIKKILNEKTAERAKALMESLAKGDHSESLIEQFTGKAIIKAAKIAEKLIGSPITKLNKYVGDAALNAMAKGNYIGVPSAINFAKRVSEGLISIKEPIEYLFKAGLHEVSPVGKQAVRDLIEEYQDKGGVTGEIMRDGESKQVGEYAKGGEVFQNQSGQHFASLYPKENALLHEVKGRVSNYLSSIRPDNNSNKLPFDRENPQKQKKSEYEKALNIAAHPIGILNHMNKGNLTPTMMNHFKNMYPELHEFLSQKITERIIKAQLKGEKPPYKKRQAMSLFLGTDLDSSFSAQSIASVQALYLTKGVQQGQMAQKNKKGTSSLTKASNQYQTDEQAREKRMQNQRA